MTNDRVQAELERTFGAGQVTAARARFDGRAVPLVAPGTLDGFREALALARRDGLVVLPTGLGSKLSWTRPPARVDFLLSTWAYAGIEAYEPGDGTLTARAGTTLFELASRVASGGHALTPDVPRPRGATLGGVLAAAQSGADRLRHGPVRDHVLGLSYLLSDGTLARSGGRLVKNVTGYDLHRLFTGSHGSLGLIVEASLRLFPLPEEECVATLPVASPAAFEPLARALLASEVRPWALVATGPAGGWMLHVRLGGRREVVAAERLTLERLWPHARFTAGNEARRAAEALRDAAFGEIDGPRLCVLVRPTAFALAHDLVGGLLDSPAARAAFTPRWRCEPGLATLEVALGPRAHDPKLQAGLVTALRHALAPLGGRVRLLHAPADLPPRTSWGEPEVGRALPEVGRELPEVGLELMQRLRARLDPARVFAAGRFLERR